MVGGSVDWEVDMGKGASGDHQPAMVRPSHPGAPVRDAVIAGHTGDLEHRLAARRATPTPPCAPPRSGRSTAWARSTPARSSTPWPTPTPRCVAGPVRWRVGASAGRDAGAGTLVDALAGGHCRRRTPTPSVVECAAWALGEAGSTLRARRRSRPSSVVATAHADPLCREAAVAALGAIGDPAALDSVLAALEDKPAVRRRATIALAAFDDPRVDDALRRCLEDRDWQVRQAAEDLLGRP